MPDSVTAKELYIALQDMERRLSDQIAGATAQLVQKLTAHEAADLAVEKRVLVIETERAGERSESIKHTTWVGFITSAVMLSAWEVLRRIWK